MKRRKANITSKKQTENLHEKKFSRKGRMFLKKYYSIYLKKIKKKYVVKSKLKGDINDISITEERMIKMQKVSLLKARKK